MADILNVVVRVMPSGEEHEVELPRFTTGKEIREALLSEGVAPRVDAEGNHFTYNLVSKQSNVSIDDAKTLHDLGINDGDTILFIPKIIAGSIEFAAYTP